jgi:hypothetical protein
MWPPWNYSGAQRQRACVFSNAVYRISNSQRNSVHAQPNGAAGPEPDILDSILDLSKNIPAPSVGRLDSNFVFFWCVLPSYCNLLNINSHEEMLASTSCFVMRQEPWDALEKGLLDADSTPRNEKVVVLSGVPGCGKSYLVRRFMTEHRSK